MLDALPDFLPGVLAEAFFVVFDDALEEGGLEDFLEDVPALVAFSTAFVALPAARFVALAASRVALVADLVACEAKRLVCRAPEATVLLADVLPVLLLRPLRPLLAGRIISAAVGLIAPIQLAAVSRATSVRSVAVSITSPATRVVLLTVSEAT